MRNIIGFACTTAFAAAALSAQAVTLTTLASFNGANGSRPYANLIADAAGNLYGTTSGGGSSGNCSFEGCGTVFRLDAANNYSLSTLVNFDRANGAEPFASLIADAAGNLYGTTALGGSSGICGTGTAGCGTVFRLDPVTSTLTTLASFDFTNGANPNASLIADAAGNLYGTTRGGGISNAGTVFRLDPVTGTLTTLVSFDGANGAIPYASLIADAAGNLYGTTVFGGSFSFGTVFWLDPVTSTLTTLVNFNGANGERPFASLVADTAGNLYGTTLAGGSRGRGTVFRLDPVTSTLTTLANFNRANGAIPYASLIADAGGNLYGTTSAGGYNGYGTVFRLDPVTSTLTTLVKFNSTNGESPFASLIADAAGNLYGTTYFGGRGGAGTVFRVSNIGDVAPVPAPGALLLFGLGAAALLARRRVNQSG